MKLEGSAKVYIFGMLTNNSDKVSRLVGGS